MIVVCTPAEPPLISAETSTVGPPSDGGPVVR